MSIVEIFNNH